MRKVRTYAVLASIAASVSLLGACSDDEANEPSDTDAVVESPAASTPPATAPAPATTQTPPAASSTPDTTQTPPATSSTSESGTASSLSADESSDMPETDPGSDGSDTGDADDGYTTDITPEPDSQ